MILMEICYSLLVCVCVCDVLTDLQWSIIDHYHSVNSFKHM